MNLSRFVANISKVRMGPYNTFMITGSKSLFTCGAILGAQRMVQGAVPQSCGSVLDVRASPQLSAVLATDGVFVVTRKTVSWAAVSGVSSVQVSQASALLFRAQRDPDEYVESIYVAVVEEEHVIAVNQVEQPYFTKTVVLEMFAPVAICVAVIVVGQLMTKKFKKVQDFELEIKLRNSAK